MTETPSVKMVQIDARHEGQRIDNFLITHLKGVPKSFIYRILRKGEVRVNKKRIKPEYRLNLGDNVRVPPVRVSESVGKPAAKPSETLQQQIKDRILYEDSDLLIINKPAGLAVHGGSGISLGLIEVLRAMRPQDSGLELVHRLDRDTSGCLILAKKRGALKALHELLRNNQVEKIYLALVKGYWPKHLRLVDAPLLKNELRSGERIVTVDAQGKEALTEFKISQRLSNATLLEVKLLTGRTHQIRVHTTHAGYPIAGDDKYGDKDFNKQMRLKGCKRLFLHASRVSFTLNDTLITVTAELEDDLKNYLKSEE